MQEATNSGNTDTTHSIELSSAFSLKPSQKVETDFWFPEFKQLALEKTIAYQKGQVRFQGASHQVQSGWILGLILFCFGLLAFIRSFHRKRFNLISKILFNWKLGKQIIRYEKVYTHPVNLALIANYLIASSLFFAFCFLNTKIGTAEFFSLSSWFFLFLLTYQLVKFILYLFSAWLFEQEDLIKEYLFHVNLLAKFQGIAFLLLLLLASYSSIAILPLTWIGIGLFCLSLAIQLLRGTRIGLQKSKGLILIILYLCTLEILPLLILVKAGLNWD